MSAEAAVAPQVGSLPPWAGRAFTREAAAGALPASVVRVITCACEGTESSRSGCRALGGMVLGCPLLTTFQRLTCP